MKLRLCLLAVACGLLMAAVPIPFGFFQSRTTSAGDAPDTDVVDWITRVEGQGSGVSAATSNAVQTFVVGLKADGAWSKVKRMSIYAGNSLDALKAPLVNDVGTATDALNDFASTNWSETVGLTGTGAGSTKYISTGVNMAGGAFATNSVAMVAFVRVAANGTNYAIGAQTTTTSPSTQAALAVSYAGLSLWDNGVAQRASASDGGGHGFYVGSRTATNVSILYKDGLAIATNTTLCGALPPTTNVTVHATWDDDGSPVAAGQTSQTLEMYALCSGLDATDVANFHTRYATLRSDLGRTQSGDPDFNEWLARVQREGSDIAAASRPAISNFVVNLKADNVWSNLLRLNVYCGTNLAAAKVPLRIFIGPTADTLVAFDEADFSEATGLTGNGSDEYNNTGVFANDVSLGDHDLHLATYIRIGSDAATVAMGTQAGSDTALYVSYSAVTYWDAHNPTTGRISTADSSGTGLYIGTRTAADNTVIYKAGAVLVSGTGSGGSRVAHQIFVHALNNAGAPCCYNARTFEIYSIGLGLSATQATNYHTRYGTLRTAIRP